MQTDQAMDTIKRQKLKRAEATNNRRHRIANQNWFGNCVPTNPGTGKCQSHPNRRGLDRFHLSASLISRTDIISCGPLLPKKTARLHLLAVRLVGTEMISAKRSGTGAHREGNHRKTAASIFPNPLTATKPHPIAIDSNLSEHPSYCLAFSLFLPYQLIFPRTIPHKIDVKYSNKL
jgi:hypothetical protein